MEQMIELLKSIKDDVDFENCKTLIDDGILESFDILQIISELNDAYDISIPAKDIIPENFIVVSKSENHLRAINADGDSIRLEVEIFV